MEGEKELNNAPASVPGDARPDKSLEEELSLEPKGEDIESLKARLAKAEDERENYRKGMMKYKKASEGTPGEEDETDDKNPEDVRDDIGKLATSAAMKVVEKSNEQVAISRFTSKYPALKDPDTWKKVVENYVPRAGKLTADSIEADLEAALLLAKHYGGGKVAEKEVSLSQYATVSRAGSIASHDQQEEVSASSIEFAEQFGHSVEDIRNAGKEGSNVIHIV